MKKLFHAVRHEFKKVLPPPSARFWSTQIRLMGLLLVYSAMHELVGLISRDEVLRLSFGSPKRVST